MAYSRADVAKKLVNGVEVDLSDSEKDAIINIWNAAPAEFTALELALQGLRQKRDRLLKETDFYGNSDVTMADNMTTYRQALRDLPNGLDTVSKVDDVTWPTKPS
jgi:hypothetical protein